jgi:hypothetical protein
MNTFLINGGLAAAQRLQTECINRNTFKAWAAAVELGFWLKALI